MKSSSTQDKVPHDLIVATQVDDLMYTGTPETMEKFEDFIRSRYRIGRICGGNFKFNGIEIKFDRHEKCFNLSQPDLKDVTTITLERPRSKQVDLNVLNLEKNQYRSITGSLLWFGTQTAPHLFVHGDLNGSEVGRTESEICKSSECKRQIWAIVEQ